MKEIFHPNSFKTEVPPNDLNELVAHQLNLLYTRVCEKNQQEKTEVILSFAIYLQKTTINANFLEEVYLRKSDDDGIWIDEEPFFVLVKNLLVENDLNSSDSLV